MPFRFGGMELIIILVIVLIIFGVGRLPEIGGALGKSIREFRDASNDEKGEKDKAKAKGAAEPPTAAIAAPAEAASAAPAPEEKPQA